MQVWVPKSKVEGARQNVDAHELLEKSLDGLLVAGQQVEGDNSGASSSSLEVNENSIESASSRGVWFCFVFFWTM